MVDIFGREHSIKQCTTEDIPVHFNAIKEMIPEKEALEFYMRMEECVMAGSAYAIDNDSCFLYYINYERDLAHGVALYGKDHATEMLVLFSCVFNELDTNTFKLDFKLHPGKFLQEYKSLLTMISMKRMNRDPDHPLVIRIDDIKRKINHIYERKGLV